jgi:hypothetical protein
MRSNRRKNYLAVCILTIVVFGTLTISTAKIETPIDGIDTYGFPLTFFIRNDGMCLPCLTEPTETYYWKLLVDIAVAFLLSIIIWFFYTKLRKRWRVTFSTKGN